MKWLSTNKYERSIHEPGYLFVDAFFYNFIILKLKKIVDNFTAKDGFPITDRIDGILRTHLDTDLEYYRGIVDLYRSIISSGVDKDPQYFQRDLRYVHRVNEFQALYFTVGVFAKLERLRLEWLCPDEFLDCVFVCKYVQGVGKEGSKVCSLDNLLKVSLQYLEKFSFVHLQVCELRWVV